ADAVSQQAGGDQVGRRAHAVWVQGQVAGVGGRDIGLVQPGALIGGVVHAESLRCNYFQYVTPSSHCQPVLLGVLVAPNTMFPLVLIPTVGMVLPSIFPTTLQWWSALNRSHLSPSSTEAANMMTTSATVET